MTDHMGIFEQISGDLGIGTDPLIEARRAAWDLFHAAWTKDTNGNWHKSVRIFLLPNKSTFYAHSNSSQHFWGRNRDYTAYFTVNEMDCRYLAPLDLEPGIEIIGGGGGWEDVNTRQNANVFRAIAKKLGVEPQFIDFKELFLNGIELDMMITNDRYHKQLQATAEDAETVNAYLSNQGRLGAKASNAEVKQVKVFLTWAFFGLSLPSSQPVGEIESAIRDSVCPPIVGRDVARARHIVSRADDIFGHKGTHCRGKSREQLLEMVAEWDAVMVSVGVTPPHRAKELKISKIDCK